MIRIPEDVRGRDLSMWLNGCYFLVDQGQENYILGSYVEHGETTVGYVTEFGEAKHCQAQDIACTWPVCGSINTEKVALYVQRLQRRQYKRSFNWDCVDLTIPNSWFLLTSGVDVVLATRKGWPIVKELFYPEYITPREALELIVEGQKLSVAVDSNTILCHNNDNIKVYFRGELKALLSDRSLSPIGAKPFEIKHLRKSLGDILW